MTTLTCMDRQVYRRGKRKERRFQPPISRRIPAQAVKSESVSAHWGVAHPPFTISGELGKPDFDSTETLVRKRVARHESCGFAR